MLGRRLISAFVIISLMLALLRLDFWLATDAVDGRSGLALSLFALLVAALAAGEMVNLWKNDLARPGTGLVVCGSVVMTAICCLPVLWQDYPADCPIGKLGWPLIGVMTALGLTFAWEMKRFDAEEQNAGIATSRLGRSMLVYIYLATLFGFLIPHRMLQDNNGLGLLSLVALIATVKLSDSFAYFVGKSYGTVRVAPQLSPKKTLQGSFGALAGGCVGAAVVVYLIAPWGFGITVAKPWWWTILYGVLVTLAGMFGDLAESLLKRDAQCKDSSSWLPGLGGVLDIIDSLIFAAPVSYALWIVC